LGYATEDAGLILPTASATTSARRRIAGNLSLLTIAEAIARGVALITSVVAARQLGPAKLGEVALAMTLSFFF
jgi:O-antigen/teichoic acid export membrane protein